LPEKFRNARIIISFQKKKGAFRKGYAAAHILGKCKLRHTGFSFLSCLLGILRKPFLSPLYHYTVKVFKRYGITVKVKYF
jgi:hypothetical protein